VQFSFASIPDELGGSCHGIAGAAHPLRARKTTAGRRIVWRVKNRGNSSGSGRRRFAITQFCWLGPGEVVVLDVLRTGRIGVGSVLLWLAVALSALAPAGEVRTGVRAGTDLVARLVFLPARGWSAVAMLLDVAIAARAWYSAGRSRRDEGTR
jgi:hypothetical protein